MASLIVAVPQRCVATGGPTRSAKAPLALRWSRRARSSSTSRGEDQSMHGPSGTYASDRLIRGSERCSTSAAPTISSPSNQPTDSERQSFFTSAHAGVWRKLADGWVRSHARCSAAVMSRTEMGEFTLAHATRARRRGRLASPATRHTPSPAHRHVVPARPGLDLRPGRGPSLLPMPAHPVPEPDHRLTIGEVARRSGLTASALRFYDREGVLVPADVDPVTGYRRYAVSQVRAARLLASLRRVGMPLAEVALVLDEDALGASGAAADVVAAHEQRLVDGLADARREIVQTLALLAEGAERDGVRGAGGAGGG